MSQFTEIPTTRGFFKFIDLRMKAWWARQTGSPPPSDPVLNKYWFPNCYRELDKGTIYFQEQRRGADLERTLVLAVAYRLLNRRQTFEMIGGLPVVFEPNYIKRVADLRFNGIPIFTSRHQVVGWRRYQEAYFGVTRNSTRLARELLALPDSQARHYHLTASITGVSNFFAWQIYCDLMESGFFEPDGWVYLGPGPMRVMQAMYGKLSQPKALKYAQALHRRQNEYLPTDFTPPPGIPEISLKNVEHSMCEYFRYVYRQWHD